MAEPSAQTGPVTTDRNSNEKREGKEPSAEECIQQPGEVIAPEVPHGYVEKIAQELYGFKVTKCKQLNGYDDKNYHIRVSPTPSNPHVTSASPDGYVMKVVNSLDTRRPAILYAQIEFMQHLRSRGIPTQEPVPSIKGENITFYDFPSCNGEGDVKKHAVSLRTFLPGSILNDVTLTPDLCFKAGVFLGSMTKALEDFHHPFYDTFTCLWSLNSIPKLAEFVHVITDVRDRRVVDDVIQQFTDQVLPRRSEIRSGYIHGDPNEQNILVQPRNRNPADGEGGGSGSDAEGDYVISGILDYQDAADSHPLYDLAMAIAYLMIMPALTLDPLEVGGHVMAGYRREVGVGEVEGGLVGVCVAGRLVQSLVLGAYSHSLHPANHYLLLTAARGWHVLHALWDTPRQQLQQRWTGIQQEYTDRE
ncbi:hypothetical protein ACOMHN_007927 [Nucella lapillus]